MEEKYMGNLKIFLDEQRLVRRWVILVAALMGAFVGAVLMFMFALMGLVA